MIFRKDKDGKLIPIANSIIQRFNDRIFTTTHSVEEGVDYYDIEPLANKYITGLTDFTEFQLYINTPNETPTVKIRFNGEELTLKVRGVTVMPLGGFNGRQAIFTLNDGYVHQTLPELVPLDVIEEMVEEVIGDTYATVTYVDGLISGVFRPSGNWNANTNTPTLANNTPANVGKVYYVTNAGTQFGLTFAIGDKLAFIEGGVATKWDNVDDVTSVNGKVGTVVINADDIPFDGSGTNYLTAKTEVEGAVKELDTRVKTNADNVALKVNISNIVNNLTSTDTNKPLSANQGKVLQDAKEALTNKAVDFSVVNDTKYPTTNAVKDLVDTTVGNIDAILNSILGV